MGHQYPNWLSYAILDRLADRIRDNKTNRLHDFSWKVALLRQTRSDKTPVSISYFGNFVIDGRSGRAMTAYIHSEAGPLFIISSIIIARRLARISHSK